VSGDLLATGLFDADRLERLGSHIAGFPELPRHRLFFEYRLHPHLELEGYGHGFGKVELPSVLQLGESLPTLERIAGALAEDPFAHDRPLYLDIGGDSDPEFVEYDFVDGSFSDAPGVFFSFPTPFRWLWSIGLPGLEAKLGALVPRANASEKGPFWEFLEALMALEAGGATSSGFFRLGLCSGRPGGWVRILLIGPTPQALMAVTAEMGLDFDECTVNWLVAYLQSGGWSHASELVVSITILDGVIVSLDIEAPHFHKMTDPTQRAAAVGAFCHALQHRGLISATVAGILSRASVRRVGRDGEGRVLLNHFKFGVSGATRGRIKTYFEMVLRPREPAPRSMLLPTASEGS